MKHILNLTEEELEIEEGFARGEYESVPNLAEEKLRLQKIARNTIAQKKSRFKLE